MKDMATQDCDNGPRQSAIRTLKMEEAGLAELRHRLETAPGDRFVAAVELLKSRTGRVIVSGVGKSGHVGQKIAATLASTGTPSFFVHPAEASHGDLGMITRHDAILAISRSGETAELHNLLTYSRRFSIPLVAITAKAGSTLAQHAEIVLELPTAQEACPHGLAPSTSTTMQLALGDCLAIAILEAKEFTAQEFGVFHPGGSLGAGLKRVSDLMHIDDKLPIARPDEKMESALLTMTKKAFGCVGVVDEFGDLIGIITDGDLRRHMGDDLLRRTACEVMTSEPRCVAPGTLAAVALKQMNAAKIGTMFILEDRKPVGIVHVHDLLRAGVM